MTDVYTLDDDGSAAPFIRKNGKMWSLAGTAFDHAAAVHTIDALNAYEREDVSAAVETVRKRYDAKDDHERFDRICASLAKVYERLYALENPNPCKTREQVEAQ